MQGTNRILHNESTTDSPGSYLVIDLNVTDVDGDKLEYKLVGGADKSRFLELNMSASSVLAFGSSDPTFPGYDNANDLNGDNIYEVEIEVTDGNPSHAISLALQVEIVRPYFVVNGKELTDGTIDLIGSKGVYENNSSVIYLGKSDLWDNNVTYTTDGGSGVSQDLFEINATNNLFVLLVLRIMRHHWVSMMLKVLQPTLMKWRWLPLMSLDTGVFWMLLSMFYR